MANRIGLSVTINERGNGLPGVGDYVPGDDGALYRVREIMGSIRTGAPGESNYLYAIVEPAEWRDCPEGDEFPALAILPEGDGQ